MSEMQLVSVSMLHGLWLLPALAVLMVYGARRRRQQLARFIESGLHERLGESSRPDPARRVLKGALMLLAIAALVTALARPAWDIVQEDVVRSGRDVVFLLDVSRSMLAEDLPPNRLERAKLAILDAVDRLEGDRVALAVFAGSTVVKCPLTLDYGFFRLALDDVSPLSVTRGGSLIGDGLRTVLSDVFDAKRSNYRDIVLITDGEDHESFPVEAAAEAGELGVRLIAIGLGDERVGHRIPVGAGGAPAAADDARTFLQHEGQEVWSRLDADTLRRMADATPGGRYLNVATGAIDFGDVYRRLIAAAEGREIESREIERLEEKFQIFLAVCLLLLALEMALLERPRSRTAAAWLFAALAVPATVQAASVRSLVNDGNDSYRGEAYGEALEAYDQALEQDPDSPYASLNRANALYRSGEFAEAAEAYAKAVRRSLDRRLPALESAGLHNLGNALYKQAEQVAPSDPGRAIELLEPAARSYLDALQADARRTDSAHNLEVTRQLIHELRERASQQPQQGQQGGEGEQSDQSEEGQDGESEDVEEQMREAADEQDRLAQESEELERDRREQGGASDREEQRQRAEDLSERQQELNDRTEQLADNADPQQRQQLEDARRHQEQSLEDLADREPGEAAEAQRAAADALRGSEQDGQPPQSPQAGQAEDAPSSMEQAATLEEILAKEKQDRRERQMLQQVGIVAVEKDW